MHREMNYILYIITFPYVLALLILYILFHETPYSALFISIFLLHIADRTILYFHQDFVQENQINLIYLHLLPPAVLA